MIELSMVRDVVTIVGVVIGFTYYVLTVRNAQRVQKLQLDTRQLQLYTTTIQPTQKLEWYNSWIDVMYRQEWEDVDEYMRKYGPTANSDTYARFAMIGETFHEMGILVEQKAIEPDLLYKHTGRQIFRTWEKMAPVVREIRTRIDFPLFWRGFEHLYNEFKKQEQLEPTSVQ